jgi:hypothetical protein
VQYALWWPLPWAYCCLGRRPAGSSSQEWRPDAMIAMPKPSKEKVQEVVFLHQSKKSRGRQKMAAIRQIKSQCSRGTRRVYPRRTTVAIHINHTRASRLHHPQSLGGEARWKIEGPPYACASASHFPSVKKTIDTKGCAARALTPAIIEAEDGRSHSLLSLRLNLLGG